jgi:hypothetical protein
MVAIAAQVATAFAPSRQGRAARGLRAVVNSAHPSVVAANANDMKVHAERIDREEFAVCPIHLPARPTLRILASQFLRREHKHAAMLLRADVSLQRLRSRG